MKKDYTHIAIVLDRSGSMQGLASDAEGGLDEFIKSHRRAPGKTTMTVVRFDDEYEMDHEMTPIDEVGRVQLKPRGSTALLDAVGRTIEFVGERLSALAESERPEHVFFVIVTDGYENASHTYTKQRIRDMVQHQTALYNWHFVFLGAGIDAFAEGHGIGITTFACMDAAPTGQAVRNAYRVTAAATNRVRQQVNSTVRYTDEERESVK